MRSFEHTKGHISFKAAMVVTIFWLIIGLITTLVLGSFFVGLHGCAGRQATPKQNYTAALEEFTGVIKKYNIEYEKQDDATKAKWKQEIDPIVKAANAALDTWGDFVDTPDADQKRTSFMTLKNELWGLLLQQGIIKVIPPDTN